MSLRPTKIRTRTIKPVGKKWSLITHPPMNTANVVKLLITNTTDADIDIDFAVTDEYPQNGPLTPTTRIEADVAHVATERLRPHEKRTVGVGVPRVISNGEEFYMFASAAGVVVTLTELQGPAEAFLEQG